jgi:hypothetical protein
VAFMLDCSGVPLLQCISRQCALDRGGRLSVLAVEGKGDGSCGPQAEGGVPAAIAWRRQAVLVHACVHVWQPILFAWLLVSAPSAETKGFSMPGQQVGLACIRHDLCMIPPVTCVVG